MTANVKSTIEQKRVKPSRNQHCLSTGTYSLFLRFKPTIRTWASAEIFPGGGE